MSRFERRMGKANSRRSGNSPRPGTATCKLRPKNTTMLSNTSTISNTKNNEVITNQSTSMLINEVAPKVWAWREGRVKKMKEYCEN